MSSLAMRLAETGRGGGRGWCFFALARADEKGVGASCRKLFVWLRPRAVSHARAFGRISRLQRALPSAGIAARAAEGGREARKRAPAGGPNTAVAANLRPIREKQPARGCSRLPGAHRLCNAPASLAARTASAHAATLTPSTVPNPTPFFQTRTQMRVDSDFAQLVLDDGDAAALLLAQDAVDQGRLAGAEEAWERGWRSGGEAKIRGGNNKHAPRGGWWWGVVPPQNGTRSRGDRAAGTARVPCVHAWRAGVRAGAGPRQCR